jgi:predicted transcriptional regulator of viral defense system
MQHCLAKPSNTSDNKLGIYKLFTRFLSIMMTSLNKDKAAELIFRKHGILRASQAIKSGIHPEKLYQLRDRGVITQISRGVYRLSDAEELSNPDLVMVSTKIPQGIICLISALSFYDLTTQIPHAVYIALPNKAWQPQLDYPPIKIYRMSGQALTEGIKTYTLDSVKVRIYCPAKTVADCFKFRNKIGLDVAIEALKEYRSHKYPIKDLLKYARICRVEKIITPYLEALG